MTRAKVKPKKLTQKQAWLAIARQFRKARKQRTPGICDAICALWEKGQVGSRLHDQLHGVAFRNCPPGAESEFWWPLTPSGDRERVKFCLARAKEARG